MPAARFIVAASDGEAYGEQADPSSRPATPRSLGRTEEPNHPLPSTEEIEPSGKGAAMRVPSNRFSVRVQHSNGISRLRLAGRFDSEAVRELDRLIEETEHYDVQMDLRNVTSFDVAAWLAVMGFEHRAHDRGKELHLVNTPSSIRWVFELTATEHLLTETQHHPNGRPVRTDRRHEVRG